ncbi:hypothetical protein Tco_1499332 [Tanacetum coccineum]
MSIDNVVIISVQMRHSFLLRETQWLRRFVHAHWVNDVDFNINNHLCDFDRLSISSTLVGILPLHSSFLQSYLRTAISNYGVALGRSPGSGLRS